MEIGGRAAGRSPEGGAREEEPREDGAAEPRLSARERAAAGSLALAALALRLFGAFHYRFNSDEAQHAHVAWGWTRGLVQYRDLFDNHTPLFHMLFAPLLAALGESARVLFWLRLAMLPLYLLALAQTWLLGRRLFGPRTALWGTLLTALLPPFLWKTVEFRSDVLWVACWLGALACLLTSPSRRASAEPGGPPRKLGRFFAGGLLLGAAAAVSLKSILMLASLLAAAAASFAYLPRRSRGGEGGSAAAIGAAACGALVVPLALVVYFWRRQALEAMLAGAVGHNLLVTGHGAGAVQRLLVLCAGLPLLHLAAARATRATRATRLPRGDAGSAAEIAPRLVLLLVTGFYLLGVQVFWPLVTAQTYLPAEPLLALWLAHLATRGSRGGGLRWGVAVLALAFATELAVDVNKGLLRGNETGPQTALLAATSRLTGPGDPVFDLKGETIFRRRAFFPVLEDITREAMLQGRIADTIPEAVVAAGACAAVPDSQRLPPRGRAFLARNFINVGGGSLRVCGKLLLGAPAAAGVAGLPLTFTLEIPARYAIVGRDGPARGQLDGSDLAGPRTLAAGAHRFTAFSAPPYAIVWAQAVERGFSPWTAAEER